jgi:hypothetical protein
MHRRSHQVGATGICAARPYLLFGGTCVRLRGLLLPLCFLGLRTFATAWVPAQPNIMVVAAFRNTTFIYQQTLTQAVQGSRLIRWTKAVDDRYAPQRRFDEENAEPMKNLCSNSHEASMKFSWCFGVLMRFYNGR